ncbi:hypothetical protein HMN09_00032900 [Mycena chlorophos]|uniref:ER transporter 6TM N-terminal domain-containing protein n=1 Tax=Mycena chlorophos TaxID=658473 RepID=A0A8H6WL06_MYCCL|nr:hypothetical protein HMN09_00032900 [Mycena chlorophos]
MPGGEPSSPVIVLPEKQSRTPSSPSSSSSQASTRSQGSGEKPTQSGSFTSKLHWPSSLQWVPDNFTWAQVKPVWRCAVAAWISGLLFLVPRIERVMGNAGFLILITAFMSPPADPFLAVLERELSILLFVTATWGWSCLGIKLADLARVHREPTATLAQAVTGQYIEAAPSVIMGIFIFVGTVVLLYIRSRNIPSQIFACILACLCLDTSLTAAALFPFPNYLIGQAIVLPIALHSAVALLCSFVVFPQTISSQFTTRLGLIIAPLARTFELHQLILAKDPYSDDFSKLVAEISSSVAKGEAELAPLAASARLLTSDLTVSRYAPTDFVALQQVVKRMAVRAHGMTVYFKVVDPTRERFPVTPVVSRLGTPVPGSPAASRPPSPPRTPIRESAEWIDENDRDTSPPTPSRRSRHSHTHSQHHHHHNSLIQSLHLHLGRKKTEHAVGVFESQRYLDLEANLVHPHVVSHTKETTELLGKSCTPLLKACQESMLWVQDWLVHARRGVLGRLIAGRKQREALKARIKELDRVCSAHKVALEAFRNEQRHLVLEPWRPSFDTGHLDLEHEMPPHRHLFHCYVYQYHLLQVSLNISTLLDEIHAMETAHQSQRLWTPAPMFLSWTKGTLHFPEFGLGHEEEDPDKIIGVPEEIEHENDLWTAKKRDPDALPPRNNLEWVMNRIYRLFSELGTGNTLYALKGGILTVLMCLPSLMKSSATFAYENKFVWGIFMAQVTLARFRGDTVFGLSSRVFSTFLGGILGMVMWYISAGSGSGSAYGLAAVCAVCFPFFFYGRIYYPGPPMKVVIFFVTSILVIGYSYQDQNIKTIGTPGFGWEIAWRRFILVTSGVVAAGIFSLLPPSTTIRRYERTALATSTTELGTIYCDIISYANSLNHENEMDPQKIITGLIAIRSKISRSLVLKGNAIYEFSLKGRWPAKRYHQIIEVQQQLAYSLSHLMSVVEHMDPAWSRAFLRRTRFLDSDFQGDVLAVISMTSTALRTGCALPQITPCPLLARFQSQMHGLGLHVIHKDAEEDYGLPRHLTLETLRNEQYLRFCVGVATAYNVISRLDRLMYLVKEVVGEQYHIRSAALSTRMAVRNVNTNGRTGVPMGSRTQSLQLQAPGEIV